MINRPKKLEFRNEPSHGREIYADLSMQHNMIEFKTKEGFQTILQSVGPQLISCEPWIQFKPESWDSMIDQVLKEMVDLWNEKYANK